MSSAVNSNACSSMPSCAVNDQPNCLPTADPKLTAPRNPILATKAQPICTGKYMKMYSTSIESLSTHPMMNPEMHCFTKIQPLREQDRLLPAANVGRMMQRALPASVKIARDARCFMQEALSEFICFVTSEVNDLCLENERKAMLGEDFLTAMNNLDFAEFVEPMTAMLSYNQMAVKAHKKQKRAREAESCENDEFRNSDASSFDQASILPGNLRG
mmetsp:Transcript_4561/g.7683  ORF Transcript_4561/g.7683 Transcript_4561/m.7683 type:complete len:216 (-) Transcript_4561:156-803(-)